MKLTTFLAPYDHVLITCSLSFQVFRGSIFYFESLHLSIQVQIRDTRRVFLLIRLVSVEDLKELHFALDSEDKFYGFWFTLRKR